MWNLMVVEDETIVRIGLRYMLKWESFGVHWKAEASNGEEALRIMDKEEIHIVMTDIRMPGMDGLELARQIKQRNPQVELLFLSSYDNFSYAKEALRLGAADYLHKPTMDEEEVAGTLRKVVTRLEETQAVKQSPAEEDRSEYLLSLLDKYTIPGRPSLPELETEPYREGYVLTVIRKREDAVCDDAESEHLRFLSVRYLVDEFVSKDWGGLVFHRHFREILWLAPAAAPSKGTHPMDRSRYLESLRHKILELLNTAIIYSASSVYSRVDELPKAYMEALLQFPVDAQSDSLIVRKTKQFIDRHLLEDITLTKVAAEIHVSPGYLSRVFLKEIGEHFSDYVIRNKLELAQKQLRESNKKVYEIAADIGYTNPHYFSKLFKERVGVTPLEYRNQ